MFRFSRTNLGSALLKLALAFFLGSVFWGSEPAQARSGDREAVAEATVALAALPREAREVYRLIHQGGPFEYEKDGTVFQNRERLLPIHPRGYYREYTVKTPGLKHRGARRIVCGGREVVQPKECYYTADHYASFRRIAQ